MVIQESRLAKERHHVSRFYQARSMPSGPIGSPPERDSRPPQPPGGASRRGYSHFRQGRFVLLQANGPRDDSSRNPRGANDQFGYCAVAIHLATRCRPFATCCHIVNDIAVKSSSPAFNVALAPPRSSACVVKFHSSLRNAVHFGRQSIRADVRGGAIDSATEHRSFFKDVSGYGENCRRRWKWDTWNGRTSA